MAADVEQHDEDVTTWEQAMRKMRDPTALDSDCRTTLLRWYQGVMTSTQVDDTGKGVNHSEPSTGWTLLYLASYFDKVECVLELLLLGADPLLRPTPTERNAIEIAEQEHRDGAILILRAANQPRKLHKWHTTRKLPRPVNFVAEEQKRERQEKLLSARSAKMAAELVGEENFAAMAARLFDKYDQDKSGSIETSEVREIFRELHIVLSEEETEALVMRYDADSSGHLDLEEFTKLAEEANFGSLGFEQKIRECFVKFDADKSGDIDIDELQAAFDDLQLDLTRNELEALIEQYDVDRSGVLDEREFMQLCKDAKEGFMASADDAALEGGTWSKKEHDAFLRGLKMFGENWRQVANHVKSRTAVQTRAHFTLMNKHLNRGTEESARRDLERQARIAAIQGAKEAKADMDEAAREAEEERLKAEAKARKIHDEQRRGHRRTEAILEAVFDAQRATYGRKFEPDEIDSWEEEAGFRVYLRQHNVKLGTRRPASPRTRERLRKEWQRDKNVYYGSRMKTFRKKLLSSLASDEFAKLPVWRLRPADGVEQLAPTGKTTQAEFLGALVLFGHGQNYEKLIFPGRKNTDPYGDPWDTAAVAEALELRAEKAAKRQAESGMDLF